MAIDFNAILKNVPAQYGGSQWSDASQKYFREHPGTYFDQPALTNLLPILKGGLGDPSELADARKANPILDQLVKSGAIGYDAEGHWFSDESKWGPMIPQLPSGAKSFDFVPANFEHGHVKTDASGKPVIDVGSYQTSRAGAAVQNPNALYFDPNYGWITPEKNVVTYPKTDWFDQLTSTILPALIGTGLGAGFAGVTGLPSLLSSLITNPTAKPSPGQGISLLKFLQTLGG